MAKLTLPHSEEGEKGLLCSLLHQPSLISEVAGVVTPEWWYGHKTKVLWKTLCKMWQEEKPIDMASILAQLKEDGVEEMFGGGADVMELELFVPSSSNWKYYLNLIREKYVARLTIQIAEDLKSSAYDPSEKSMESVTQNALIKIATLQESGVETKPFSKVILSRLDYIEDILQNGVKIEGVPTGFPKLDAAIRGLRKGNMIVIGAPRKTGKSAFATTIAMNVALQGKPVGIFSMEMSQSEIADRFIAAHSKVNLASSIQSGLSARDQKALLASVNTLATCPVFLRDESVMTPTQFRAAAQKLVTKHKCELLVVDYVQLMTPESRKGNRENEVAECSRLIKTTAQSLQVPIIVLSQVNDDMRSRESRAIEQDANIFMLLSEKDDTYWLEIKAARDCATTSIPFKFLKEFTLFEESVDSRKSDENKSSHNY